MKYLTDLGLTSEEINTMSSTLDANTIEKINLFPSIVKTNFNYLKNIGINNYKNIFMEHSHMFLLNPDRFNAIFEKYDKNDLVRCLEKNGSVIEKL